MNRLAVLPSHLDLSEDSVSIIKCSELAYFRMRLPDPELAERFLHDFGLLTVERTEDSIYLRGTDPVHHCYIVERGPKRMLGFAFSAKSMEDLHKLSKSTRQPVEAINEVGGGYRVRLQEPNGYCVEIVYGMQPVAAITMVRQPVNTAAQPYLRAGEVLRLPRGRPTLVKRLAHVVLATPNVKETISWFQETLGLISSDEVYAEIGGQLLGAFMRADNGAEFVDHHSLYVTTAARAGLQHVSFEAQDMDAVLADHHYLKGLGRYNHVWGIGRHMLGSQLFDYWHDPFGYVHEHWADSDRLNADTPTGVWTVQEGLITQWGEPPSDVFRNSVQP